MTGDVFLQEVERILKTDKSPMPLIEEFVKTHKQLEAKVEELENCLKAMLLVKRDIGGPAVAAAERLLDNPVVSVESELGASNEVNASDDGITHINVYSKGKTKLGRLLSNFADTPFVLDGVRFASVESFWYYTKMINENKHAQVFSTEEINSMAAKKGYDAKAYFRKLSKDTKESTSPTADQLKRAYQAKLAAHPIIKQLLQENTLPFAHYYLYLDKKVNADQFLWTAGLWSDLK